MKALSSEVQDVDRCVNEKQNSDSGETLQTAPSPSQIAFPKDSSESADERLPFSPDEAVERLREVLRMLESITDHNGDISSQSPLPKARVFLRGIIGIGIAGRSNTHNTKPAEGAVYGAHEFEPNPEKPEQCIGEYGVLICGLPESNVIHHTQDTESGVSPAVSVVTVAGSLPHHAESESSPSPSVSEAAPERIWISKDDVPRAERNGVGSYFFTRFDNDVEYARVHQPPEQNSEDENSVSPKPKALSHSSVVVEKDIQLTLAYIRERRAMITEPPWQTLPPSAVDKVGWAVATEDEFIIAEVCASYDFQGVTNRKGEAKENATFIANAPTDYDFMLSIIDGGSTPDVAWACVWEEDSDGVWQTNCQNAYQFTEGSPSDNRAEFCCYCGKPISEVGFQPEDDRQTTTEESPGPASFTDSESESSESTLVTVDEAEAERIRIVAYLSYDTTYSDNFCLRCSHDPSNCECHNPVYMSSDWTPSDELKALKVALFQEVPASAYRAGRGHPQLCPSCGGSWRHNKGCIATELSVHQPDVQAAAIPTATLELLKRQLKKLCEHPCPMCSDCIEILTGDVIPIVDSIIERLAASPVQPEVSKEQ